MDALEAHFSPQIFDLWKSTIVSICWTIWRIRNSAIFDYVAPSIHTAISLAWCYLKEANSLSSKRMTNSMEDLIIVKNLNISIKPPKAPRIVEVISFSPLLTK